MENLVSVIIPIRKNEDISRLLYSLNNSTYKNMEIIVVDESKERSIQRNIGINRAKGEYLFIPDSDWVVTSHLIEECVELMSEYDAVYIPEIIVTKGWFAKIRNWERQFYTATPIDVVRFVKTRDCPKFDEEQSGTEDNDWDRRVMGLRTISKNPYFHYDNVGFLKYFNKKVYYTKSMDRFIERNHNDKIFDFKWRCFKVFFEDGKWKRFISNPIMASVTMFTIFLKGIILLINDRPIS